MRPELSLAKSRLVYGPRVRNSAQISAPQRGHQIQPELHPYVSGKRYDEFFCIDLLPRRPNHHIAPVKQGSRSTRKPPEARANRRDPAQMKQGQRSREFEVCRDLISSSVCMYVCMYVCKHVWYVCMYVFSYVCLYVCVNVCMYVYMHGCMYVCM